MKLRFNYKAGKETFEKKTQRVQKELKESVFVAFRSGKTGYQVAEDLKLKLDETYYLWTLYRKRLTTLE